MAALMNYCTNTMEPQAEAEKVRGHPNKEEPPQETQNRRSRTAVFSVGAFLFFLEKNLRKFNIYSQIYIIHLFYVQMECAVVSSLNDQCCAASGVIQALPFHSLLVPPEIRSTCLQPSATSSPPPHAPRPPPPTPRVPHPPLAHAPPRPCPTL